MRLSSTARTHTNEWFRHPRDRSLSHTKSCFEKCYFFSRNILTILLYLFAVRVKLSRWNCNVLKCFLNFPFNSCFRQKMCGKRLWAFYERLRILCDRGEKATDRTTTLLLGCCLRSKQRSQHAHPLAAVQIAMPIELRVILGTHATHTTVIHANHHY